MNHSADSPSEPAPVAPASRALSPATDSPWFWLLLFCGMGCLALAAISPRYAARQQQIERNYQMREQVRIQKAMSPEVGGERALAAGSHPIVTLRPLFVMCAALCVLAALALVWRRRRRSE